MNARGSAMIEFCVIANVFALMVGLLLISAYAILARGQLEYRTEQGLYCLAEDFSEFTCVRQMKRAIASTLPFGRVTHASLTRTNRQWKVDLAWKLTAFANFDPIRFKIKKSLAPRDLPSKGDLHW